MSRALLFLNQVNLDFVCAYVLSPSLLYLMNLLLICLSSFLLFSISYPNSHHNVFTSFKHRIRSETCHKSTKGIYTTYEFKILT